MTTDIYLESDKVLMRPLLPADAPLLQTQAGEEEMWQYFTLNLSAPEQFGEWMEKSLQEQAAGTKIPFAIVEKSSGMVAGSMSIGNISAFDQRAEIGWSWLGKQFRGTDVNRHAKFLLLRFLFETWNFERVEFKTDVLNERAKNGLRKLGATEEGILRSHMKMWNNRRRTSVYFSILKQEWASLKQARFNDII